MIGQRLSHYQIVEKIGAGGMGVVYRAHDEQLDRDVAIKVLPSRSLADEVAQKRFRKEALSLARLNHPNIATVHEFGSQDGVDFLVTEFIAGITLDSKLSRGPLPSPEVVRLGVQLAAGLEAAHQHGVIHRDLKPGNIRLTTDGRLKILDFGLAQLTPHASELGATVTRTQSQDTSGTLPYMSPEQLSGEVADARSDIWAAGAVLYEMSTGKRPFEQTVPALLINAILNQAPESPRSLNPAVPDALDQVILKALARERQQRYQSAAELGLELDRLGAATAPLRETNPTRPGRKLSGGLFILAAVALALVIGAFYLFLVLRNRQRSSASPVPAASPTVPVKNRRSVAVLGFKNLSGNPEKSWLSTALSEMMTTELSQGDQLRTIAGESVAQMKASLALPDADTFSPQTLTRIRQNLGSDDVVLGSYVPLGNGQLRLDVRLQDALVGETLVSVSEKGNESEIDSLVSKAGAELRAKLGVGELSDAQLASVRAALPSNPEAARLYAEGLQKLRVFDARAARESLEKAAALEPQHALTHAALAEAWSILGYDKKAKDEAKKALDLSAQVSREGRLLIEGRAHEMLAEMPQAIESYQALWQFFPDNVDYGFFLIRVQVAGGHAKDADKTLADLRKLSVSGADAVRIDLAEAAIAFDLSDSKRQLAIAERATTRAEAIGASLLVAQGLRHQAQAWERLGDSIKPIALSTRARELYIAAGDRRNAARAQLMVGDLLNDQGNFEGARKQFDDALIVFREVGAEKSLGATLGRIGNVYYSEGKMVEARKYYEQNLHYDEEINDLGGLAGDYGNLANALDGLGDLPGALKMQQKSLAAFKQVDDRRGASATLNNLGDLFLDLCKLDEARKYYEQSLAMTREIAFRRGEPYPITGIGDTLFAQGDLAGARKQYEQAMVLCKEMNNEDYVAQLNLSLAMTALAEKKYADGQALALLASAGYEKSGNSGSAGVSQAILARNFLAAGNLPAARNAAKKALSLSAQSTSQAPHFEAALADARVKARSGKTAEAIKELDSVLASARKFGYKLYEYQTHLAIGEIELWSGSATAHADLAALEKDATAQGALLVAGQAGALLGATQTKAK